MELNKEYKQISVNSFQGLEELKGKVIDDVKFINYGNHDEQSFTIVFKDKTFISVGLSFEDDLSQDLCLSNNWIINPKFYAGGLTDEIWFDDKGNYYFKKWIQNLIDLGIWEVDIDEVVTAKKQKEKEREEKEYQEYLRLKEKFENK